jgi:hypothetical protein
MGGALNIVNAELGARVLAKIEFGQVAIKMLFINVLIDAYQAAL